MGASIPIGTGFFGATATLLGFALLLIWALFLLFKIRVRRKGIRLFSAFLTCVTLSMVLGLWRSEVLSDGTVPGGSFGNWISGNCEPTGLAGFALFLAVISFIGATLLATDWLFLDYFSGALGLGYQTDYGSLPVAGNRLDWRNPPFPADRRKKPVEKPSLRIATVQEGAAVVEKEPAAKKSPPETSPGHDTSDPAKAPSSGPVGEESLLRIRWWEAPDHAEKDDEPARPEDQSALDTVPDSTAADKPDDPADPLMDDEAEDALVDAVLSYEAEAAARAIEKIEKIEEKDVHPTLQSSESLEELIEVAVKPADLDKTADATPEEPPPSAAEEPQAPPAPQAEDVREEAPETAPKRDSSFFERAAWLVVEEGEATISILQKRLNLGYFRSAKLIDQLEKRGIIAPPDKNADRNVLVSRVELQAMLESGD
jgi:hypothetical protein